MTLDSLRLIQLLQILLFLLSQGLPPHTKRLVHPLHAAEADNRTSDPLVDPGERDLTHLPTMLIGNLLHTLDDRGIRLPGAGVAWVLLLAG